MKKLSIGLIDDHIIVREGFKSLVQSDSNFEVTLEASSGDDALELMKEIALDVLITDISLPTMSGIELCHKMKTLGIHIPVIILSMHNNKEYLVNAYIAGAKGYLVKDCDKKELYFAIQKVLDGGIYFGDSITLSMLEKLAIEDEQPHKVFSTFTKREKQILICLKDGESTKKIAEKLFISPRTVDKHRANMMAKVGVHNLTDLLKYLATPMHDFHD